MIYMAYMKLIINKLKFILEELHVSEINEFMHSAASVVFRVVGHLAPASF